MKNHTHKNESSSVCRNDLREASWKSSNKIQSIHKSESRKAKNKIEPRLKIHAVIAQFNATVPSTNDNKHSAKIEDTHGRAGQEMVSISRRDVSRLVGIVYIVFLETIGEAEKVRTDRDMDSYAILL